MLKKAPGFTAIALVTLAVGIGANTMMSSIADWLLFLQPGHVKNYEQLAYCDVRQAYVQYPEYVTIRDNVSAFSDVMARTRDDFEGDATLVREHTAWHVKARYVSSNYFSFLGVAPVLGRGFRPAEEQQGGASVVVLSHPLWQRLGGSPKLVGEYVNVNGAVCQVVGVAPKGFTGTSLVGPDLWVPLGNFITIRMRGQTRPANARAGWGYPYGFNTIGRLKPGVSMSVAQTQLQALIPRFRAENPQEWPAIASFLLRQPDRIDNEPIWRPYFTKYSLILMAGSVVTLLIVCLNLASMLIVQGASRHREIAIRLAVGGGRLRIIRQLLVESALLALLGGVLGVLLAVCGMRILNVWFAGANWELMRAIRVGLDIRILMGTLGFCLIATLLFGLRPALRLSRPDLAEEMKGSASRVLGSVHRKRGGLSVAGQIALAVVLVLVAALLLRSALETARPDPGFRLDDKVVVDFDPLAAGYDQVRSIQAYEALVDHLATLPQVKAVGTSNRTFFGGGGTLLLGEYRPGSGESLSSEAPVRNGVSIVTGRDYFKAMEIPLLQGRLFEQHDRLPNAEKVVIVDRSLARKLRPEGNALGCFIQLGIPEFPEMFPEHRRIVGIVAHVPGIESREVGAQMFTPSDPNDLARCLCLHVANTGAMDVLQQRIFEEIHRLEPRMPIFSVTTLAQERYDRVWTARFGARIGLAAGAAALFLATLGIYAIKGYMVASRTPEIGIRMALGATHGLALGLAVAKVAARFLYGISPIDPVSIVITVALLGATSLLAGYLPARRAARVDPMVALRYE